MKIGMLTFYCAPNYGAVLTSYALYRKIKTLGYSPELIRIPYSIWPNHEQCRDEKNFSYVFLKKYCDFGPATDCERAVYDLNDRYDCFLTGSDQLWCSRIYDDSTLFFFQDFAAPEKGKISYATSLGERCFTGRDPLKIAELLRRYNAVSVRESEAADYLWREHHIKADCCLDPVFLLEKKEYQGLIQGYDREMEKGYLLVHFVGNRERQRRKRMAACEIAKRLGLSVKSVEIGVPVEEYLFLMAHADYVVTDSFHGMCFSIIFHKQFLVLPEGRNSQPRFEEMKELFGIGERLINRDAAALRVTPEALRKEPDYIRIQQVIDRKRREGEIWLKGALEKVRTAILLSKRLQLKVSSGIPIYTDSFLDDKPDRDMFSDEQIHVKNSFEGQIDRNIFIDQLKREKDPEAYVSILKEHAERVKVFLCVNRELGNGSRLLAKLQEMGLLKTNVGGRDSFLAIIDKRYDFVYENRSSNRIVYRYEWPGREGFWIVSEGIALEELTGDSSVKKVANAEKEYSMNWSGLNITVFDAQNGQFLDSCNMGEHREMLVHKGMTDTDLNDKEQIQGSYLRLPDRSQYEKWQQEKEAVRTHYTSGEMENLNLTKLAGELKNLYIVQKRVLFHVSQQQNLKTIKAGTALCNMYGETIKNMVFASSDEIQQLLYAARCVACGMRVWGRNRICFFENNPFQKITKRGLFLKKEVSVYRLPIADFEPTMAIAQTLPDKYEVRFDDEWHSTKETVCPVSHWKIQCLDPELLQLCEVYIPGENFSEEYLDMIVSAGPDLPQVREKMAVLEREKIISKVRMDI